MPSSAFAWYLTLMDMHVSDSSFQDKGALRWFRMSRFNAARSIKFRVFHIFRVLISPYTNQDTPNNKTWWYVLSENLLETVQPIGFSDSNVCVSGRMVISRTYPREVETEQSGWVKDSKRINELWHSSYKTSRSLFFSHMHLEPLKIASKQKVICSEAS